MAMSIFDLKAGLKTDTNLSVTKPSSSQAKHSDFRSVLENVQKIRQSQPTRINAPTESNDNLDVSVQVPPSSVKTDEVEHEVVVQEVAEHEEVEQKVADVVTQLSNPTQSQETIEVSDAIVQSSSLNEEMKVVVNESDEQIQLTNVEVNVAVAEVPFSLAPQQRIAVHEFEQMITQLNQFMNGKLQLDEQQLQALMAKLMKFLQQNADWMETNPMFKNKPVAEFMVALNQLLSGDQKPNLETLQKLIAQFQKVDEPVTDAKNADAKQTTTATSSATTSDTKSQPSEPKLAANAKQVVAFSEQKVEQPAVAPTQAKATEPVTVSNQIQQQITTQQLTTAKPEQTQTFTPQQLPQEMQKLVKSFRLNRANGTNEARFALNPEHLGHINVKISVTNGSVVAQIYTDTAMAKETLDAQLLHLRAALQSSGLIVEKLEIFNNTMLSQQFHEQKRQQSSQQFNKQQKQKHVDVTDVGIQEDESTDVESGIRLKMGARIDVTA